jgi:triosephosphate isomerase
VSRPALFIANWKLHHGPEGAREFVATFLDRYPVRSDRTVVLCPPAISIPATVAALGMRTDIAVGAQHIAAHEKGAFTGEIAASMAAEAGASFALIGHSERRKLFGETSEETAAKCAQAIAHGLVAVLCVGETLEEREAGRTLDVVLDQVRIGLGSVADEALANCAIAYEPVWAIGTGRNATPEDAASVHTAIRSFIYARAPGLATQSMPILYGGSVNAGNAAMLLGANNVKGLLVGGASLDPARWAELCLT